jgi:hypothetical protein
MNISYCDLRFGIRRLGIPLTLRCYRDRCVIVAHQTHRFATVSKGISYSVLQIRKQVQMAVLFVVYQPLFESQRSNRFPFCLYHWEQTRNRTPSISMGCT